MRHLQALVGVWDCKDTNATRIDSVCELLERAQHFFFGNDDDLFGFTDKPTVCGLLELLSGVDGGHDDSDIFLGRVCRVLG